MSIVALLAGLLVVAVIVPLVLASRRSPDHADTPTPRSPLRWVAIGVLGILVIGIIFVFVQLTQTGPRGTQYSNLLTIDCQRDPDAIVYLGNTAMGSGQVITEILGSEEFCILLNLQATVADVERELLASLPAGSKFVSRPPNPVIVPHSEHAGYRLGVYRVERPDGSLDDMMVVAWHLPDRAFAVPIRLRSGDRFAIDTSGGV
ncbi:MAG: hypothetical protein AAF488_08835, partial [Planctomycetota bacterium]